MARKTSKLSYNLYDRGRNKVGKDRSNIDFPTMINMINSEYVQELVNSGSLYGYYGHSIRQRFGMRPPETVIVDGKTIHLEPAFKTTYLKANTDGTVEHKHEFLNNDAGEYALRQYSSRAGGFSTAVNYIPNGTMLTPSGFFGYDYVLQPNYANNGGDGQLYDDISMPLIDGLGSKEVAMFDSILIDNLPNERKAIAQILEKQIIELYDNIHTQNELYERHELALQTIAKSEARKKLQQERNQQYKDSLISSVSLFDDVQREARERAKDIPEKKEKSDIFEPVRSFFGGI